MTTHPRTSENGIENIPDLESLNPKECRLLELLLNHHELKRISILSGRRKTSVIRTFNKFARLRIVDKRGAAYYLTSLGIQASKQGRSRLLDTYDEPRTSRERLEGSASSDCTKKSIKNQGLRNAFLDGPRGYREKIDLHNLSFTVQFWRVPVGWDKYRLDAVNFSDMVDVHVNHGLRNVGATSFIFQDFRVIAYSSSIRVWMPRVVRNTPEEATGEALSILFNFLPLLEKRFKLPETSLLKNGRLNIRISTQHYAIFESVFAKWLIREKGHSFFEVPIGGERRLIVDKSDGFHTEAVHPAYAGEDVEPVKTVFQDYLTGKGERPAVVKDRLDELDTAVGAVSGLLNDKLVPTLDNFSTQLQAHTATATANLEAARALNRALDRADRVWGLGSGPGWFESSSVGRVVRTENTIIYYPPK